MFFWPIVLTSDRSDYEGLQDGGLAGMLWTYVWSSIGFGFIIVSLAEMASM